jgi:putative DNA primase/helicase
LSDSERIENLDGVLAELRPALRGGIKELAERLLGDRNKALSTNREWRWGSKGSIAIVVNGAERGACVDYEADWSGDPFKLIQREKNCDFLGAVRWGAAWAGIDIGEAADPDPAVASKRKEDQARQRAAQADEEAADRLDAVRRARWWWSQRKPLPGTLGAVYLASRGIGAPADGWPDSIAFWPADGVTIGVGKEQRKYPAAGALMVSATDDSGAVCAVQRIYLDAGGCNVRDSAGNKIKRSTGALRGTGAVVRLPGPVDGPLLLAEGPETGLSLWLATGHETRIAIGGMPNHKPPAGRHVVICRDDDAQQSPADKALSRAIADWRKAGVDLVVATPWPVRRDDRSDFNDVLVRGGIDAVRAQVDAARFPYGDPPSRLSVEAGRRQIETQCHAFFDTAQTWGDRHTVLRPSAENYDDWQYEDEPSAAPADPTDGPPCRLICVDVGSGKSDAARRHAAAFLAKLRAAGDKRNVVMAVPMHRLSTEQEQQFSAMPEAAGLRARIWYGRNADNPAAPGEAMCRNLDLVREVSVVKLDIEKRACAVCPFGPKGDGSCAYLAQKKLRADIWFVAHAALFSAKPKAIGEVAALIVDESPIGAALEGVEKQIILPLDVLNRHDSMPSITSAWDARRLSFLRTSVRDLLSEQADGPINRTAMMGKNMTAPSASEAAKLEWLTQIDVELKPGLTRAERGAVLQPAQSNADLGRRVMMWHTIAALLADDGPERSGWLALTTSEPDEDGQTKRYVILKGCRQVSKGWVGPTLCLDATGSVDLLRRVWPNVQAVADIRLQAPHLKIWQAAGSSHSLSRLAVKSAYTEEERAHRVRNLEKLHATLHRVARAYAPARVLIVVQKAVAEALADLPPLPSNIERDPKTGLLPWHNSVRGIDRWGQVRAVVVVGRTLPSSTDASRAAEALTGCAIPFADYERVTIAREMADGTMSSAETRRHPDPLAESWRAQVCEGEVTQIIGRGRGVNRTAVNPLDVLVLTDVVLPLPVQLVPADHVAPSLDDRMIAAAGIAWRNGAHAALALPEFWPNPRAADKALEREKSTATSFATFPYIKSSNTGMSQSSGSEGGAGLVKVEYQQAGAGKRPTVAWIYPEAVPDPAATLAEKLGKLAFCRISSPQPAMTKPSKAVPMLIKAGDNLPPLEAGPPNGIFRIGPRGSAPRAQL